MTRRPILETISKFAWPAFLVWLVILTVLSATPGSRLSPLPFENADKVAHFLLFFTGSIPLLLGLRRTFACRLFLPVFAWAIMAVIAVGDEIHQIFTQGRSGADLGDVLADMTGAAAGLLFTHLIYGKRIARPHPAAPDSDRAS